MGNIIKSRRYPQAILGISLSIALLSTLVVSNNSNDKTENKIETAQGLLTQSSNQNVPNPELPPSVCENLQVVILLDRSGSVTGQGAKTVQVYKDQVKKVWQTLHNVSATYDGYTSGTLWAFAGRTANQMPLISNKDINGDGTINSEDLNIRDRRVLQQYNDLTQNIYFSNNASPEHPNNQPFSMGYNPKKEDRNYFTRIQYTNWHEALLMAQETVKSTNTPNSGKANHSIVLMITDGVPTVNDGPNHNWDNFARNARIDEQHDGNQNTANHATRAKAVVDALRQGRDVRNSASTFDPVQVYGILIGGGTFGANKMASTFGNGNWFQSQDFDSTIGSHILNVVANSCPPEAVLVPEIAGQLIDPPTTALEGDNVFYTVELTNTGTAALENVTLANGTVTAVLGDDSYSNEGILSAGMKRRFVVSYKVGASTNHENLVFNYSADVADDHSLLVPGSPTSLTGQLTSGLSIVLIPRPV